MCRGSWLEDIQKSFVAAFYKLGAYFSLFSELPPCWKMQVSLNPNCVSCTWTLYRTCGSSSRPVSWCMQICRNSTSCKYTTFNTLTKRHEGWKYEIQLWNLSWSCGVSVHFLTWLCVLQIEKSRLRLHIVSIFIEAYIHMHTLTCAHNHAYIYSANFACVHLIHAHTPAYECTQTHTHNHASILQIQFCLGTTEQSNLASAETNLQILSK